MVEYIWSVLQLWSYKRLIKAEELTKPLAPKMEERLQKSIEHGRFLTCEPISRHEFKILGNKTRQEKVDLNERTCTCKKYDMDGIPFQHAVAAIIDRAGGKYEFCSWFFTVESLWATYAGKVYPCGHVSDWILPDDIKQMKVEVPNPRPAAGRPKNIRGRLPTKRILSQGERVTKNKYGQCGLPSHNKQTCRWA